MTRLKHMCKQVWQANKIWVELTWNTNVKILRKNIASMAFLVCQQAVISRAFLILRIIPFAVRTVLLSSITVSILNGDLITHLSPIICYLNLLWCCSCYVSIPFEKCWGNYHGWSRYCDMVICLAHACLSHRYPLQLLCVNQIYGFWISGTHSVEILCSHWPMFSIREAKHPTIKLSPSFPSTFYW